ncbi:MAG: metallopeptidase TldD-related protein, partial [Nitrospinales bacterium]
YNLPDFSRGQFPIVQVNPTPEVVVDFAEWENLARTISVHFKKIPEIEKSRVLIFADRSIRYYLDSEGNKLRETALHYGVTLEAWSKTKLGYTVEDQETLFFTDPAQIPSRQQLAAKAEQLIAGILALRSAPKMEPFVGPALFSPDATAMLFHEAIGHRLEGDRLRTNNDGKTFAKKIGRHILPSFLSIVDNPTVRRFNGEELLGHYEFDDDGQRGQEVVLIEQGALKNFLLSRNPAPGFNKTNGHARSDGLRFPISRMSNFFIRSDQKAEPEQLKQRLIEEIKRQNKPYGIMIKKMLSGETQTHKDFQVFKGTPLYVYKVYPEDGREELVQGVEFVGTPLSMINKVILTGKDDAVLNAYCGAESGFILVTSVAPSILLSEVELQSSQGPRLRLPILPPPIIHD